MWDFRFSLLRVWRWQLFGTAPCCLVEVYPRSRGAYCLASSVRLIHRPDDRGSTHLWNVGLFQWDYSALQQIRLSSSSMMIAVFRDVGLVITLMMEAVSSSETSVNICQTSRRNDTERSHRYLAQNLWRPSSRTYLRLFYLSNYLNHFCCTWHIGCTVKVSLHIDVSVT
jgi:hypothetical protein